MGICHLEDLADTLYNDEQPVELNNHLHWDELFIQMKWRHAHNVGEIQRKKSNEFGINYIVEKTRLKLQYFISH